MAEPARNPAPLDRPVPTRPVHKPARRPALFADALPPEPLPAPPRRLAHLRWAGGEALRLLFVGMVAACVVAALWVRHGA